MIRLQDHLILEGSQGDGAGDAEAAPDAGLNVMHLNVQQHVLASAPAQHQHEHVDKQVNGKFGRHAG